MSTVPVPSGLPDDFKTNVGRFDEVMTSDAHYYTDRLGVRRWTIAGFQYTAEEAIRAYGYVTLDSFEDGATMTLPNEVLRWESNGEYYRWDGALPKTVAAGSTPDTTGGVGAGAWVSVGDAALRQYLFSSVIQYVTPEMYGAVSYDRKTIFGSNKNSASDIAAAVASGSIVDSTSAIQQAVDSGKAVYFGGGIYYTSKPIVQGYYTGDMAGMDVVQTGICKYTSDVDSVYGVDAIWILGDNAGSSGGNWMRYKSMCGLSLSRAKLAANSGTLQQPKAVENFFDYTDVNLIPYGYGFYAPRIDHFQLRNVHIHGSETNFYTKNMWMSRLSNVWAQGGNGYVIEAGTSYTLEQVWSIQGSWNTYDSGGDLIKKYYPYDLGGVYVDLANVAVDYSGADGRPCETLYNFRQGAIANASSVGAEQCHARRITGQTAGASGFTTSHVNIDTISVDMMYNRYGDTSLAAKRRVLFDVPDYCNLRIGSGRVRCVYADRTTSVSGVVATNKPDIAYVGLVATLDLDKTYMFVDTIKGVQLNGTSWFKTWASGASTPVAVTASEVWIDSGVTNSSSFSINNGAVDITVSNSGSSLFWDNGNSAKTGNTAYRYGGYQGYAPGSGNVQMRASNDFSSLAVVAAGNDGGIFDYATNQWVIRHSNITSGASEWSIGSTVLAGDSILNFKSHASTAYTARLVGRNSAGAGSLFVQSYNSGQFGPFSDNVLALGGAANRWTQVYAATGSINTSDETIKNREEILDAEKNAALEIKADIWKFKFKDAEDAKNGKARYHFGVGAQSVGEILRKNGLNPDNYAFYCYDEWEDVVEDEMEDVEVDHGNGVIATESRPTGKKIVVTPSGSRYGIRYEELLCFIMMAL